MGAALKRPFKNFNVESRAFKVIEEHKTIPKPAPRYPSEAARLARNEVGFKHELDRRIPELDERLKHIYVESQGDNPVIKPKESSRPLPTDRKQYEEGEFGYLEPRTIPAGKLTLVQATDIITSHKDNPDENTAEQMATKYNLDLTDTHKLLEYFHPFNFLIPKPEAMVPKTDDLKIQARKLKQAKQLVASANEKLNQRK